MHYCPADLFTVNAPTPQSSCDCTIKALVPYVILVYKTENLFLCKQGPWCLLLEIPLFGQLLHGRIEKCQSVITC